MHTNGDKIEKLISIHAHNRKNDRKKSFSGISKKFEIGSEIARRKGKVRVTLSLLPTTIKWLKKHDADGNMSECVDEVVRRIVAGELVKSSIDKPS
jgi:polysaccharide deacetylase 2 family uncharacterized protein YibQ